MDDETSLTGVWSGIFSYPSDYPPETFTATLLEFGGGLTGTTHQVDVHDATVDGVLLGELSGFRDGTLVSFVKTYVNLGRDLAVAYIGELSADATEVEGTWTNPWWSGRFLMIRDGRTLTAERRAAFQDVGAEQ